LYKNTCRQSRAKPLSWFADHLPRVIEKRWVKKRHSMNNFIRYFKSHLSIRISESPTRILLFSFLHHAKLEFYGRRRKLFIEHPWPNARYQHKSSRSISAKTTADWQHFLKPLPSTTYIYIRRTSPPQHKLTCTSIITKTEHCRDTEVMRYSQQLVSLDPLQILSCHRAFGAQVVA
jgi:hypothetical protein